MGGDGEILKGRRPPLGLAKDPRIGHMEGHERELDEDVRMLNKERELDEDYGQTAACPPSILVQSPKSKQASKMGTFILTEIAPTLANGGRGIYQKPDGPYLYYWDSFGEWRVG